MPKLLIVEGNDMSRRALETLFRLRNWRVTSAKTLSEAMNLLWSHPDYVILDLALPDGDGEAILRKIREEKLAIKVVITTGYHEPERMTALDALRPDAVMHKPLDFSKLCRVCSSPREGFASRKDDPQPISPRFAFPGSPTLDLLRGRVSQVQFNNP